MVVMRLSWLVVFDVPRAMVRSAHGPSQTSRHHGIVATTMDATKRRQELATFLRAHREALSPDAAGVRAAGRRRTPGLRREEVALIAGVGVTWYTWLEQGRDIQVSRDTLLRIARALQLTPSDMRYLLTLATPDAAAAIADAAQVDPQMQLVVDCIDRCPAFVVNARWDVTHFNRLADRVYDFDGTATGISDPLRRNHFWRAYMDPERRRLYEEWETVNSIGVGMLRSNYALCLGDPAFESLLETLCASSPEFARAWAAQHTHATELSAPVVLRPRGLGRLAVHSMRFPILEQPRTLLLVLPPADDATAACFDRLAHEQRPDRP
jgi:transcriptional regulator with XRE-family HTH domain